MAAPDTFFRLRLTRFAAGAAMVTGAVVAAVTSAFGGETPATHPTGASNRSSGENAPVARRLITPPAQSQGMTRGSYGSHGTATKGSSSSGVGNMDRGSADYLNKHAQPQGDIVGRLAPSGFGSKKGHDFNGLGQEFKINPKDRTVNTTDGKRLPEGDHRGYIYSFDEGAIAANGADKKRV